MEQPLHPATPLAQLPGLAPAARIKLHAMGVDTLADLCRCVSRTRLRRLRQIGPKSEAVLLEAVEAAGLVLPEYPAAALEQRAAPPPPSVQQRIDAWVAAERPEAWRARQQGAAGGYGGYLRAQLEALDQLVLPRELRQQQRHRLVRLLGRYRREVRYAASRDALRDGVLARG